MEFCHPTATVTRPVRPPTRRSGPRSVAGVASAVSHTRRALTQHQVLHEQVLSGQCGWGFDPTLSAPTPLAKNRLRPGPWRFKSRLQGGLPSGRWNIRAPQALLDDSSWSRCDCLVSPFVSASRRLRQQRSRPRPHDASTRARVEHRKDGRHAPSPPASES